MSVDPVPAFSGCVWPVDPGCLGDDWDNLDDEVKERATALASSTLRRLTGYRVGGCPVTVRPCALRCGGTLSLLGYYDMAAAYGRYAGYWPHIESGLWVNSCGCHADCSCGAMCEVALPGPVGRVDAVKVGGTALNPTDYRVDGNLLVWVGAGTCPWPACQDLTKPDTAPNTFSVTYLNGYPVDSLGAYAAGIMTMEFAKACTGNKCRLPPGVTVVSRQGVTMEIPAGSFPGGFTGIREVDAYLALWNPTPIRQAPQVFSPDLHSPRVVT